jgi:glycerol uptake facilitator-like aquaporin
MRRTDASTNTLVTGAMLFVLITIFAPISRAHFNPAVSALAIMGTVASVLTILFVPALYAAWFKVKRQPKTSTGTEHVAVEPAPAS